MPPEGARKSDHRVWKGDVVQSSCAQSVTGSGTKNQRYPAVWLGPEAAEPLLKK